MHAPWARSCFALGYLCLIGVSWFFIGVAERESLRVIPGINNPQHGRHAVHFRVLGARIDAVDRAVSRRKIVG